MSTAGQVALGIVLVATTFALVYLFEARRPSGNWAEDLGSGLRDLLLAGAVVVVALVAVVAILVVELVAR